MGALLLVAPAMAATPPSGTVDGGSPSFDWVVDFKPPTASPNCAGDSDPACDNFDLTIVPPTCPDYEVTITLTPFGADDWDLEVYFGGAVIGNSGNFAEPEVVVLSNPAAGVYTVAGAPYAPTMDAAGNAEMRCTGGTPVGNVSLGGPEFYHYAPPALGEPDPSFREWGANDPASDSGIGVVAGEPSIGVPIALNQQLQTTGLPGRFGGVPQPFLTETMYVANVETLRTTFNDCTDPANALWADRSAPSHATTLDPILETDELGRTASLQLNAKRSLYEISDDNGELWTPSVTGGGINAGVDHQTIGVGPYPVGGAPSCPAPLYPLAWYYASQDVAVAQAAISCDGGITFQTANPMWNLTQCAGLHGHSEVAPDGTMFVPNGSCSGTQGLGVTQDGTLTWQVVPIPGTTPGDDPGVGIGYDAGDPLDEYTVYVGMQNGNGHMLMSWTDDWTNPAAWQGPVDLGALFGLETIAFPSVIAGDRDRASAFFLGTTSPGQLGDNTSSTAVWHLYNAVTYDRGVSWQVRRLMETDPVQRSTICHGGTTCGTTRNLLDFNDIQIDETGRVVLAWSDGCVGGCKSAGPNSYTDYTRISRQRYGEKSLYAAFDNVYDPSPPTVARAPYVEADFFPESNTVDVRWSEPFDGNSPIFSYDIYRGSTAGSLSFLMSVGPTVTSFLDTSPLAGPNFYQVLAHNAVGDSDTCHVVEATTPTVCDPCNLPGCVTVPGDGGDQAVPHLDLETVHFAQPFIDDGAGGSQEKVILTMKVADGTAAAPNNAWIFMWSRGTPVPVGGNACDPLNPSDRNMISVRQTATGPSCHFGYVSVPSFNVGCDVTPIAECSLRPDGTISVGIPIATLDDGGPVGPGYTFSGAEVRVFASNVSGQVVTGSSAQDTVGVLPYVIVDQESVCSLNAPPIAVSDFNQGPPNQTLLIDVLANDSDPDMDPVSVVPGSVTDGQHGTTVDNGNGTVDYIPDANFAGTDQFTYTITDGALTAAAVVEVAITSCGMQATVDRQLFGADFEAGLAGWGRVRNPSGALSVSSLGTLEGSQEMSVDINYPTLDSYVVDFSPGAVDRYCTAFRFDPNSLSLNPNRRIKIAGARSTDNRQLINVGLRFGSGSYQIGVQATKDTPGYTFLPWKPISDAPHLIEIEWVRSSGADDGELRLWIDGILARQRVGLDNDLRTLSKFGIGHLGWDSPGTAGTLLWDAYVAWGVELP